MDLIGLLPSFGNFFYTIAAFVVVLSIIVAVHEYGHYIVGRWSGIHADVFSIGFGPVLLKGTDKRGTVWQIAAVPLGGYVKFAGDSGATSGKDADGMAEMDAAQRRRTMHGAPLWARAATVAAGPMFNFIFAFFVFASLLMYEGVAVDEPVVGEITALPAQPFELAPGDRILAVEGQETETLADFLRSAQDMPAQSVLRYTVERAGRVIDVTGPHPQPPLAGSVALKSAAREAQMQPGDVITAINGTEIATFAELRELVAESGGAPLDLNVWRGGRELELVMTPRSTDLPLADGGFETRYLIGLTSGAVFEYGTRTPGLVEASGIAVQQIWRVIRTSVEGLYYMIIGQISTCNLSSPIGIAEASVAMASDGLIEFVWFIAVLSVAIGLLNLFPIPPLDGGHLVFHAYEAVMRRPAGDKAMQILITVGLALVLTLFAFALFNDLTC
ncbi:RIP metalloprotease RseP [Roseinatronobacter bogoriensis]|uniref:Zinc metalloprotease n=1 Tax=Roseinatronobacter bogoriensis subsp. barguzinensis TaxID=441209 RepID=A0A2K8KJV6_9RHOB|nr:MULTISPECIES: RIP metalloprotease RseP [Rhodobaca]ATX66590.1 RIP metalloprotease RseP [Rhodobaca barguzinensis]MBB4207763.1 regulator of sigma E protease [Rhodobaca bogoriensis DSM 18756]TDW39929.1 regulator of sigma E protease [Rhodobaca barguzinensis]TDY70917.1 regulator of sigma E protease [Rhodobaca bogoriensis DSM 18756]